MFTIKPFAAVAVSPLAPSVISALQRLIGAANR
jgi:hypothetical protein